MANEVNTGLAPNADLAEAAAAIALSLREFDPAELLDRRNGPEALPPVADLLPEAVRTFDPAANLGEAARRGPATIGDGRPLVARIGGVEVVTIPLEHYAALVSPLALARPGIAGGGGTPDPDGMLLLLLSLHADGTLTLDQLAAATGLDRLDLGGRIAAYAGTEGADGAEVPLTAKEQAATFDAAAARGTRRRGGWCHGP